MNVVSSLASLAGIGSFAIQLADAVKKLSEFCSSVQDAPEDIKTIVRDLQTLSNILHEIEKERHRWKRRNFEHPQCYRDLLTQGKFSSRLCQ